MDNLTKFSHAYFGDDVSPKKIEFLSKAMEQAEMVLQPWPNPDDVDGSSFGTLPYEKLDSYYNAVGASFKALTGGDWGYGSRQAMKEAAKRVHLDLLPRIEDNQ